MMNWRKPLIGLALRLTGRPVFRYLEYLKSVEYESPQRLRQLQDEKLEKLLLHAYEQVPYYDRILPEAGVVKGNKIILENFPNIPILTKEIIRREGRNLYSKDHKKRRAHKNTSGGSTGEPVEFLQDPRYEAWMFAGRFLYNLWAGKDVGQPEIKLWGSERDILEGKDEPATVLRRWLFNTHLLNTYKMSEQDMRLHIEAWNHIRPKQVWAYTDSMYRLSRFVAEENLSVHVPTSIICTTAKLLPEMRSHIEQTFGCKVYDQYGGREVGAVASECRFQNGLHIFTPLQKLEILGSDKRQAKPGDVGRIILTNLDNYSMPLVRYEIGDTGCIIEGNCPCGRGFPLLKEISGRIFAHFIRKDSGVVHSQFFVALFFFKPWVREFKVIQKDYDLIKVLVAGDREPNQDDINVIVKKIHKVMGEGCKVEFDFVDEVPPTASGKYLYTVSEIVQRQENI
jgi:phenylacetate-CoA ligase